MIVRGCEKERAGGTERRRENYKDRVCKRRRKIKREGGKTKKEGAREREKERKKERKKERVREESVEKVWRREKERK